MPDVLERRRYERIDVSLDGDFSKLNFLDAPRNTTSASIKNLSSGGLFIETGKPLPEGSLIAVTFCLMGRNNPIHAEGLVRWSSIGKNTRHHCHSVTDKMGFD